MAVEKVGVYSKWLGAVPKYGNGRPIPKSKWRKNRRRHWVVRWYRTDGNQRYGKVFKTRKEAEEYALELQRQVRLGKADKPRRLTLHEFLEEHREIMKG